MWGTVVERKHKHTQGHNLVNKSKYKYKKYKKYKKETITFSELEEINFTGTQSADNADL